MNKLPKILLACVLLGLATPVLAQDDTEELRIAALEALISAPPERAMPIVQRVLAGDGSDDIKSRALFVLSQMDTPEAQTLLVETARSSSGRIWARWRALRAASIDIVATSSSGPGTDFSTTGSPPWPSVQMRATSLAGRR